MHSYDDIKAHLERQLREALEHHKRENSDDTLEQLDRVRDRYERFVLHGVIPEELSEDQT